MTENSLVSNKNNICLKSNENMNAECRSDTKNICSMCQRPIREMYVLIVDQKMYHEDCLRCSCCDARLAELDKFCYLKANMMLCKRDYLRLYGNTGLCSACDLKIQAFEYVMRAKNNIYHLDCFTCHFCKMRFCVGDKFYLHETNKILCEKDHNIILCSQPHPIISSNNNNNISNSNNNNNPWISPASSIKPTNPYISINNHQNTTMNPINEKNKSISNVLSAWIPTEPRNSHLKNHSNPIIQTIPTTQPNCDSQISPNKFEDVSSGYDSPSPNSGTVVN